jgi:hypothetical protein
MSKFILITSIGLLLFTIASSQVSNEFRQSSPRMISYGNLPDDEKFEDVQKNFINQNWRQGIVVFKNTSNKVTLPLIFDVYSNKLYFLNKNLILEFNEPVKEFQIPIVVKKDTLNLTFRNSYPLIHKNTNETFYQVLVDGKWQLLKCKANTIGLFKDKDVPEEERQYSKELLYAYMPNGKITLIKPDKNFLLTEMKEYADTIEDICNKQKLKLKNEAQLIKLFTLLNSSK